jgi:hypothetical protein
MEMDPREPEEEDELEQAVILLNAKLLGIVLGILFGSGLFLATNFLVLKGGQNVGVHLALLANFFPGYRVTFLGSIIGFCYAFITGVVVGVAVGAVYNKLAKT